MRNETTAPPSESTLNYNIVFKQIVIKISK